MKAFISLATVTVAVLPTLVAAESTLSSQTVRYQGDYVAKLVCRAIVQDDARGLRRILSDVKRTSIYSYKLDLTGEVVAGSFSCNKQPLLSFSNAIGSNDTSYFLSTGKLMDGQALSSSGR